MRRSGNWRVSRETLRFLEFQGLCESGIPRVSAREAGIFVERLQVLHRIKMDCLFSPL
jgi:hypothetical protein